MKKIRIISPAKSIDKKHIDFAKDWLEKKGFEVSVGKYATGQFHYFSGSDAERLYDMQEAINEPSIDFILCSRGGYGSVRFINQLDWTKFKKHPKLILGYSDVTVFHNCINKMGFLSVHSTAPLNFENNTTEALNSLVNILTDEKNTYSFHAHKLNRFGEIEAEIVGGNLAIINSLLGTDDDLDTKNKILFIEDIGEAIYAIDRMMWSLKKSRKLENLAGLIVGGMTGLRDSEIPFGKSVEELIREAVDEFDYPICFNFPAGHIDDNRSIIFGQKARLLVNTNGAEFIQN